MNVVVNGSARTVVDGSSVADLVATVAAPGLAGSTAVARNGELVPRGAWSATSLAEGDHIELLSAAPGG